MAADDVRDQTPMFDILLDQVDYDLATREGWTPERIAKARAEVETDHALADQRTLEVDDD